MTCYLSVFIGLWGCPPTRNLRMWGNRQRWGVLKIAALINIFFKISFLFSSFYFTVRELRQLKRGSINLIDNSRCMGSQTGVAMANATSHYVVNMFNIMCSNVIHCMRIFNGGIYVSTADTYRVLRTNNAQFND